MIKVIVNKFKKTCVVCKKNVLVADGFAVYDSNTNCWNTYHKDCTTDEIRSNIAPVVRNIRTANQIDENTIRVRFEYNQDFVQFIRTEIPNEFRLWKSVEKAWEFIVNNETIKPIKTLLANLSIQEPDCVKNFVPLADELAPNTSNNTQSYEPQLISKGLFKYQVDGVNFLRKNPRAMLGDDMGLGKTIQCLSALPDNEPVLIVCPSNVKYNWRKEIQKWRSDYIPVIISKAEEFRFPEKGEIVILNREVIPNYFNPDDKSHEEVFTKISDKIKSINLIVDEAHKFKGYKTQGHKKVRSMSNISKRCWLITGTPILNRATDIWGVLSVGNMEKLVFKNFNNFKRLYNAKDGTYGLEWGMPDPSVPNLISKYRIARKRYDVLADLPKKIMTNMEVSLNDSEDGKRIIAMIDALSEKAKDKLSKDNILPDFRDFAKIRAEIAKQRIPAMLEYVDDCEENEVPLVIFSAHLAPLNAMRIKSNWGIIDGSTPPEIRQQIVDQFQAGLLDGIAATIEAGGVGLTMTRASKVLFVDLDWTPANNLQAEDRLVRIGSKHNSVEVIRMISDHPLDIHVHKLIEEKMELIKKSLG